MKTVIMAGGKGTRISALFPDIPKPMIPINGKPVLEWELISLRDQGFSDIILTVSYKAEVIQAYFGDGSSLGIHIKYFHEQIPLGNAGALFKLGLADDFLLLNADAVFDVDFNRFVNYHREHGGLATLFTHPNSHPYDSSLIVVNEDGSVERWLTKEECRPQWYKNRVNAGLHVLSPETLALSGIDPDAIGVDGRKADLDRDVLKPLCATGKMFCYDSPEYVKDMGTPERYEEVKRDFKNGIVESKNLKHLQKAIFLDRDGTINRYVGFLRNIDDFSLLDGAAEAIKRINESGYLAVIVTNQPVIARGEVSFSELGEIHRKMETLLGMKGAYVDALYYCPHHPDRGFEGEVTWLKIDCACRKPKPGMLLKAAEDYHIDLKNSWIVGDGKNDILAGKKAGCKTALIGSEDRERLGADLVAGSLLEFVKKVL